MVAYQIAECSSGPPHDSYSSVFCSATYSHAPIVSKVYCSPEVVCILKIQISNHIFLTEVKRHAQAVELIECCLRWSKRWQQQYNNNLNSSSTVVIDGAFTPSPLASSLMPTAWLKKFNNDGGEDDEDQDSPDDDKDPTTAMPRPTKSLRFACHFRKRDPSRYCVAGCKYKTCEYPGWENIAGVKQHLQRQHIASLDSATCSRTNGQDRCDLLTENDQPRCHTQAEQYNSIDPAQWQLVCRLLITDRCGDEHIWFEIWAILFPGTQAPSHPWQETNRRNILGPSNMPIDSTESTTPGSATTHDLPDPDHTELVQKTTVSNTPSLLSNSSRTTSTTSVVSSALRQESANTFQDVSTASMLTSPLEMNNFQAIQQCLSPSPLELGNSLSNWSQSLCDDTQVSKNIANDFDHDLVHLDNNVISENLPMTFPSPCWSIGIDLSLRDSFQYLENEAVPSPLLENDAWDHPFNERRLAQAIKLENNLEQKINPQHNDEQNMRSENSGYMDPTWNTDSWTQSDSNGFESFEYWVLLDALASDSDLFARSLSLFQAEWQRRNIPCSPGVISHAGTAASTSETVVTSSELNVTSQKEPGRHSGKRNLPTRDIEGDETDDERRPKRQKQTRDSNKPYDGPRFACPFYKKEPSKYCPSTAAGGTSAGDKYAGCHKYGSIELHRLVSDHFKKHKIFDCTKCCEEFDDAEAALNHADSCSHAGQPPAQGPRRDGIDKIRQDEIKAIMSSRKQGDKEKWMQMWIVLFPSTPPPPSPYCEAIAVPLTTPGVESLIRTWQILIQTESRDNNMSIDQETFDHCVRLLRAALKTESTRADSRNLTSIPTPSSSSMVASTPFSQASPPFPPNRSWSRVSSRTRNMMPNTSTSSSNFSVQLNSGILGTPSNRPSVLSPSPWLGDETNRYADGTFRADWENENLLNQGLATTSQPQNTYVPPDQRLSVLPEESSSGVINTTPQMPSYESSAPMQGTAYMPAGSGWQNPPSQNRQLAITPMTAMPTGDQPQGQPGMLHELERFLAYGQDLLRIARQSIPTEVIGATSIQTASRAVHMGLPGIHERLSAGQSLASTSPLPHVGGSRSITPTHDFVPSQQAQTQQQAQPNLPNPIQSGHAHRSQPHHRQQHHAVSSQPIPSTPYNAAESNMYATSASQGFSNLNNQWQEIPARLPSGNQFGEPTSMAPNTFSDNDDLTRMLDSNYSVDDSTADMSFNSASNDNGIDPNFRGLN